MPRTMLSLFAHGPRAALRSLWYSGRARACPCCGGRFRRFLAAGVARRPDALCPRCGSLERHRLLCLYLAERTDLIPGGRKRVLHVAPEPCLERWLCALPGVDYVSIDLDSPRAMLTMDVTDLAFPDASFDVVLCNHVLEHVPDDRRAISELRRVLRRDGWGILQVPLDPSRATTYEDASIASPALRLAHFGQEDHVRLYGADYAERLASAGFAVRVDEFAASLPDDARRRYGVDADEQIYMCARAAVPVAVSVT